MVARTQDDIQKMAMEANGHRQAKKLQAVFGNANCYADGGYVPRSKLYGVMPGPQVFKCADGGMVGAVAAMKGKRDAAIEAAVNGPKPAAPAALQAPAKPAAEPDDAAIGIHIPKPAPEAPAPKKGLLQRILGLADGGEIDPDDEFKAGGAVRGPGGPTDDKIPAMLSDGEYVLPADTVRAIGKDKLDAVKAATHTPVRKARFGMANGGVPGYDVEEIPDIQAAPPPQMTPEQIRLANNPALNDPAVQARIAQANRIGSAAAPAADAAAPAAADAAPKSIFGRALGAVRGVLAPAAETASKGVGLVRGVAGALTSPIAAGAALALHSTDAGAQSDVLSNPTTGAVTNQYQGNMMTPQFAALSDPDKYKMLAERNDPNTSPARIAQLDAFMKGAPAAVNPQAKYEAPSASFGVPGTSSSVPSPGTTPPNPGTAPQPYGQFGNTTVYRRGNTYADSPEGLDMKPGGGYVPQGVNWGITPDQLAAYKAAQSAQPAAAAPQAPQYAHDTRIDQINSQIADATQKLAGMSPGQLGRGALRRQIATLSGAAAALQSGDQARNTFNENQFGQSRAMYEAAQDRAIRERELNFNHNYQYARADLDRQIANQNFDIRHAEIGNEAHKQLVAEAQQRLGNSNARLESLAKADGGDPELYKVAASTQQFPGSDGKMHLYQDLDEAARAKADGSIQLQAAKMKARKDAGLPYSLGDAQTNESPSFAGWLHAFMFDSPMKTLRFGATQTGDYRTGRANVYPSDEAAYADAAQQRARFGSANRP